MKLCEEGGEEWFYKEINNFFIKLPAEAMFFGFAFQRNEVDVTSSQETFHSVLSQPNSRYKSVSEGMSSSKFYESWQAERGGSQQGHTFTGQKENPWKRSLLESVLQ